MGNSALSPAIRRASGFSNEELSRLGKRFRKLDADSDGSVRYFILIFVLRYNTFIRISFLGYLYDVYLLY